MEAEIPLLTSMPLSEMATHSPRSPSSNESERQIDWSVVDHLILVRNKGRLYRDGEPGDMVDSDGLLFRTYREYQKGRDFRIFFLYAAALIALLLICMFNRVDYTAINSN